LWTTRNTTTVLRKLSKVAEQQQQQGATAASINSIGEVLGDARCFACVRQSKFSSSRSSSSKSTAAPSPAVAAVRAAAAASSQLGAALQAIQNPQTWDPTDPIPNLFFGLFIPGVSTEAGGMG